MVRQKRRQEKWWKGLWRCVCNVCWSCLVAAREVVCVGWRRLAGSDIGCGGGVAWVRLHVDVDGGGEGGGSRVKGKEKKDSWLDE